jgi:hypothetical protein
MNCEFARLLLVFARPGATELDAPDIAALESHLAGCDACRSFSRRERAVDESIASAMQQVEVPQSRSRALADLLVNRERARWRFRAAATLFAATLAVSAWALWPGPRFDPDRFVASAYDQVGNREGVAEWLARQDPRFDFPPRFQGRFLVSCERRNFHGVAAPVLSFVRKDGLARVAVVNERQFRGLATIPDGPAAQNSVCTLIVVRHPEASDVVYLVEVINGTVEAFYNEDSATVTYRGVGDGTETGEFADDRPVRVGRAGG